MMDKKYLFEKFAEEAGQSGVFTGTWLYSEHGEIVSCGAVGYSDPDDKIPMRA